MRILNDDKKKALQVLKTCRGQIDGIIKMIEEERYCVDISNQIIGNWKLIEAKYPGLKGGDSSEFSINYTKENIIYNFKPNGDLIVSGGDNAGYASGKYEYFFGEDYLGGVNSPKVLLVKINNSKWSYKLTNGKMILGQSYFDGPDLIFVRK